MHWRRTGRWRAPRRRSRRRLDRPHRANDETARDGRPRRIPDRGHPHQRRLHHRSFPQARRSARRTARLLRPALSPHNEFGLLLPIENDQWILSLGRRGGDAPPRNAEGFKAYAKGSWRQDVYDRIRDAEVVGDLRTFRKPSATRHLIWQASKWPDALIPIGDAMSSVNPTYGQGMTVAACEADALETILAKRSDLNGIAAEYLPVAGEISGRAWSLSINSDYVYPQTEGERPANFAMSRAVAATLRKMADQREDFPASCATNSCT